MPDLHIFYTGNICAKRPETAAAYIVVIGIFQRTTSRCLVLRRSGSQVRYNLALQVRKPHLQAALVTERNR